MEREWLIASREPCPSCGCPGEQYDGHVCEDFARIMGADAARAVGRFKPGGPEGYVAATAQNAQLRETRAEAVEDERLWLESGRHECQRCGSDEWEYVDYGGCSICRPHEERVGEDEMCDYVPEIRPDGTVIG